MKIIRYKYYIYIKSVDYVKSVLRYTMVMTLMIMFPALSPLYAQIGYSEVLDPLIKTLQLKVDGNENVLPVIRLGSSERLEVSFDCLTHEYQRFTYNVEHCDYLGHPSSDLFSSDYLYSVSDDEVIEDYEYSTNTTVLYTHYRLVLPNVRMRPLLSGNYILTINRENDEGDIQPAIRACFGVLDQKVIVRPQISADTDLDWNANYQQVSLRVSGNDLILRDADREIKLVVMQNRRMDNAVYGPEPTAQNGNELIWEHHRGLIFNAGNEYRKFEMLSTRYPGMHMDHIRWFDPYYHSTLLEDEPRRNFLFDKDNDGVAVIRCEDSATPEIDADYVLTHFTLRMPPLQNIDVYVNGGWASSGWNEDYKMVYNYDIGAYEASVMLKLGYYNYQYLCVNPWDNRQVGSTAPVEGDYYQTQNQYDILVYYSPVGSRYQQLVGFMTPIYRP